ncbi:MAG: germination protein YpeB [Clostridia bacterium]|nr:germination protein YpeB [Clostridia bacterium]
MKNHVFFSGKGRNGIKVTAIVLGILFLGAAAFAVVKTNELSRVNARMDAVTQKAFYETCELTEGMSINFAKLPVAGESGYMQSLLNEVARQTQGTLSNLALLPLGEETVSATIKFINQAGDFASGLSLKLANGGAITREDYDTLNTLSRQSAEFSAGMARLLDKYERGEAVFTQEDYEASGQESLYPITNPASEYPTLLYDGPFSDGRKDGEYKFLRGLARISEKQARTRLAAFLGLPDETGITFTGESAIPVECYEYTVQTGEYTLEAGVTKAGGEILYLMSDHNVTKVNISGEQAVEAAEKFLLSRGYGQMEPSYSSLYDGILTVNFAPVEKDVVLYPDLVKVQVSMADGAVIGFEPVLYLMNHVQRQNEAPALTPEEAMLRISEDLSPDRVRLCVIPEGDVEYLCYEITASDRQNRYLVYIDAYTGTERSLLQLINDEHGTLVM